MLELDGDRVTGYREKPTLSYDVSMGIYVYEARALEHLPDGPCQFPELVQRLLAAGEHVAAYRSEADWYDLGTIGEYERAVAELERRGGCAGVKRALITGITGQDGSYLAELLLERGLRGARLPPVAASGSSGSSTCVDGVTSTRATCSTSARWPTRWRRPGPDEIYNLAADVVGRRLVGPDPTLTAEFTGVGVARLLEAVRDDLPGGALSPGVVERDLRQGPARRRRTSTTPFSPRTPYGAAKAYAPPPHGQLPRGVRPVLLQRDPLQPREPARGLQFVHPQDHLRTPRRSSSARPTSCGSATLDAQRDWGYAPDYVEAMWLMLQQERPEDYVIATGIDALACATASTVAFGHVGLDWREHVTLDDAFKRPAEVDLLVGDASKARAGARLGAADRLRGDDRADGRSRTSQLLRRDRLLAGPAGARDRAHRLQGRVAGAVAARGWARR